MKNHTVNTYSALFLGATLFTGCSKNPSPPPQVSTLTNAAEMAAFATNSLDVLQARFQEDEKQIQEAQTKLDALRRKYGIIDKSPTQLDQTNQNGEVVVTSQQSYWDAKRTLSQMIEVHKLLAAKIQADKIDAQIPPQVTH